MEQLSLFSLEPKVYHAIEHFKMYEEMALRMHPEGYYLAFSGGKDSQVIYHLAIMAGVKFHAHYHITTVDPPEVVQFVRKYYTSVQRDQPKTSMWRLIEKKGFPPTRRIRYCCSELKEGQGVGQFVVTGVRWSESDNRKLWSIAQMKGAKKGNDLILMNDNNDKRRVVENCLAKGKYILNPILDWTETDVWSFIHKYINNYCELYDCGFCRLGCIACPMASIRRRKWELERYPKYKRAYLNSFERMLAIHTGERKNKWRSADDVFHWWLYGKETVVEQISGQISMFGLEDKILMLNSERIDGKTYSEWKLEYLREKYEYEKVQNYGAGQQWSDGIELNQLRDRLTDIRSKLLAYDSTAVYEIPEPVPESYMAKSDEIRQQAEMAIESYRQNPNYQYLLDQSDLTGRQLDSAGINNIIGRIKSLEDAFSKEDLVFLREYGYVGKYDDELQAVADRVKKLPIRIPKEKKEAGSSNVLDNYEVTGQLNIYDIAS